MDPLPSNAIELGERFISSPDELTLVNELDRIRTVLVLNEDNDISFDDSEILVRSLNTLGASGDTNRVIFILSHLYEIGLTLHIDNDDEMVGLDIELIKSFITSSGSRNVEPDSLFVDFVCRLMKLQDLDNEEVAMSLYKRLRTKYDERIRDETVRTAIIRKNTEFYYECLCYVNSYDNLHKLLHDDIEFKIDIDYLLNIVVNCGKLENKPIEVIPIRKMLLKVYEQTPRDEWSSLFKLFISCPLHVKKITTHYEHHIFTTRDVDNIETSTFNGTIRKKLLADGYYDDPNVIMNIINTYNTIKLSGTFDDRSINYGLHKWIRNSLFKICRNREMLVERVIPIIHSNKMKKILRSVSDKCATKKEWYIKMFIAGTWEYLIFKDKDGFNAVILASMFVFRAKNIEQFMDIYAFDNPLKEIIDVFERLFRRDVSERDNTNKRQKSIGEIIDEYNL